MKRYRYFDKNKFNIYISMVHYKALYTLEFDLNNLKTTLSIRVKTFPEINYFDHMWILN